MHSKFPWTTHPHTPTAVFDGDGRRIIDQWVAPEDWLPIDSAPKGRDDLIDVWCRDPDGETGLETRLTDVCWYVADEIVHHTGWARITDDGNIDFVEREPTGLCGLPAWKPVYWMPRPAPPSPAPTPLDPDTAAANAVMIAGLPGLIEALEFYRDAFRFVPKRSATGIDLSTWKPKEDLLEDCGEKARAVLASIGRTL